MPEKENETPKPADRKVSAGMVRVRANSHLDEGGYHPPGEEFEVPAKRVAALGNLVTKVAVLAAILTLGLLGFAPPAAAQQYTADTVVSGTVTNNATWSAAGTAVVTKYDSVGLQLVLTGSQAGTGNVVVRIARSGDGTYYETTPGINWTNALAGNTTVKFYREVPASEIGNAGWLQFTIQNYDASASGTNATLKVIKKPKRNG